MSIRFQLRRDTAADWTAENPTLADGEWGLETDTRLLKLGNGVDPWNSLAYFSTGGGGGGGEYVQLVAASTWTVNHNLGRRPAAVVLDDAGNQMISDIEHTSLNQLIVTHAAPITGRVVW